MMVELLPLLLLISAMSTALVAGIFYAFSSFVMAGLSRIPSEQGINAMNSINVTVIRPSFMILFMGSSLLCAILAISSLFTLSSLDSQIVLAASLLYIIGCFGVTMAYNVPLNNRLAAVTSSDGEALWRTYLRDWTMWNTVRTIAPILSAGLFIVAILRK